MITWHKHHIIPKHAGGTDDPSNLLKCNVAMHAFMHEQRYREVGDLEDKLAARLLRTSNTWTPETITLRAKLGGMARKGVPNPGRSATLLGVDKPEHSAKMKVAMKGNQNATGKSWEVEKVDCPVCGKSIGSNNIKKHMRAKHDEEYTLRRTPIRTKYRD